ncbi:rhox homeobox family member 1-like [Microtus ochrogaster]|uniref:Homeobox-leucine zipper protein ROC6 n=1 Tax=Microtus ochrogaster TaxID=79684 RepID=A0A8J6FYT7_MICOH|nr:rhox homeobox family member 1-like [Microtus ochrogaster]KAH0501215.1 Homeobox-leucine zipper protein ROC6 [Microtus ochrogaster]
MACKKYYFDQDYYRVDYYEEEVTELQEMKAAAASSSHTESVVELGHLNAVMDHNYNREDKDGTHGKSCEPAQEGQDPVFKKPSKCSRKQYKFTPKQIIELDRVFKETQYPDAAQRKELADLIKVDEFNVMVWFSSQRTKLKKNQKANMRRSIIPMKENCRSLKILKETQNVVVLQEPRLDESFYYKPHTGHPNWH